MDIYGLYIWHELSSLSDVTELRPLSDSISTYKVLIWMRVTVSRGSVMYRQNPQGRYLQNQSTGNFPSYIFSSAITVQWTSIRCKGINWGILWPVFSLCEDVCIVRHLDAEVTKKFLNIFVFDKKKIWRWFKGLLKKNKNRIQPPMQWKKLSPSGWWPCAEILGCNYNDSTCLHFFLIGAGFCFVFLFLRLRICNSEFYANFTSPGSFKE